jgi:hypothetical protein
MMAYILQSTVRAEFDVVAPRGARESKPGASLECFLGQTFGETDRIAVARV